MPKTKRLRTHSTATRLHRFNQYITRCSELDAIVTVATNVEWLATEPGRIIVAAANGQMLCKVWNAQSFDDGVSAQFDGPMIDSPSVKRVGHYVIESVRPLSAQVQSHFLTVESPE